MLDKKEMFKMMLQNVKMDGPFPPPATKHLDLEFLEYIPGKKLKHRAPIKEETYNPGAMVFGGYYAMYFDAAFGPFSFLETEKFCTSLDLNVSFLKSLSLKDEYIIVEASLISKSKTFLIMEGKAYKPDDTLVATATSRMMILDPKRKLPNKT